MGSDDGHNMFVNPCADGDFIVRALHEYHTDSIGHLSFAQFQYIKVKHCEESGWWLGESESSRGWFPSNRVERVSAVYESEVRNPMSKGQTIEERWKSNGVRFAMRAAGQR